MIDSGKYMLIRKTSFTVLAICLLIILFFKNNYYKIWASDYTEKVSIALEEIHTPSEVSPEIVYQDFIQSGKIAEAIMNNREREYTFLDLDKDGTEELVVRAVNRDRVFIIYVYSFDNSGVKECGRIENWTNRGSEMFYSRESGDLVTYSRGSDFLAHNFYTLEEGLIKEHFNLMYTNVMQTVEGEGFGRLDRYSYHDSDIEKDLSEKEWKSFVGQLERIPFQKMIIESDRHLTEEQINFLKSQLGVPDDVEVTDYKIGKEPSYWPGAGIWIVGVELYSDGWFLGGASVDPETLTLQRNISTYDSAMLQR